MTKKLSRRAETVLDLSRLRTPFSRPPATDTQRAMYAVAEPSVVGTSRWRAADGARGQLQPLTASREASPCASAASCPADCEDLQTPRHEARLQLAHVDVGQSRQARLALMPPAHSCAVR